MISIPILTIFISLAAGFAYINHRFVKMPFVIGLFFLATIFSFLVILGKGIDDTFYQNVKHLVEQSQVSKLILEVMLGFMLFAAAFHTNWSDIKKQLKPISLMALCGVLLSTLIIAPLFYWISHWFGINISFIYCLLFGALISPTDPIAVMGILTKANVPKKIESTIVGESLFNDGVGVVLFIALLETLKLGESSINFAHLGSIFLQEAVGGSLFGLGLGYILHQLLKSIDHYETEVLLTIAFVMVGYSASLMLHLSGALAMVVMGLFVGNYEKNTAMSDITLEYVHKFWELVDVILNAILFILIALVIVVIDFKTTYLIIGLISVAIVLLSRWVVIQVPRKLLPTWVSFDKKEATVLIWGGLRGGLSLALVLTLPEGEAKNLLVIVSYCCVVFSILLQGLTIEKVAKRIAPDVEKG
ncbi:MAG: sodium:proton antiporter [Saprospiraceae bacterium]|nr:sodium:proton antiporter [Saprospiraceae bacterium]